MQVKKKRKIIIANVFLFILLAAGATYAWFALNTTSNVGVNQILVDGHGDLEMTTDDISDTAVWSTYLTLKDSDTMFADLKMIDVSGIGNGQFFRPKSVGADGEPAADDTSGTAGAITWLDLSDTNATDTETARNGANKDYIKVDLHLRAKKESAVDVYLKAGSKLETVAPTDRLTGTSIENKSAFGEFSKDFVVGGIRVSAVTDGTRDFTWIPRPDIKLEVTTNETTGNTYSIKTDAAETTHKYVSRLVSGTPTIEDSLSDGTLISGQISDENEQKLVTLTKKTGTGYSSEYVYGDVNVYIWLEGYDTEARRALVGGRFTLNLLLDTKDSVS